jgi:glycosyltransferase involved in cell wall biosynthesis
MSDHSLTPVNPEKVLISIIMPVYNAEIYIKEALESLSQQNFDQYELIIIDGLSTDRTLSVIQEKLARFPKIRLLSEYDLGIYDAMNKGISIAKGEWIYFIGSDDSLNSTTVLSNVTRYLKDNVDLVYGDVLWMPGERKENGICEPANLIYRNINHQRMFYRKQLFERWGAYNLQYKIAADHELNIRFFCNDLIRRQYIPITIANYYAGGFSANKTDEVFWRNWKSIFHQNLAKHVHSRELYNKLGWYCRYQIDQKNYLKSFLLFCDVFFHTLSLGFVWLTFNHIFIRKGNYAS